MADKIPNLEVKDYSDDKYELKRIEGTIKLDAWSGFKSRQGEYNSKNDEIQSDGTTSLSIGGDMVLHNPQVSQEHLNAYNYLIQHQETIKTRILSALLGQYQELQQQYGYNAEDVDSIMPNVKNVSQFQSLIELSEVHLLNVSKDETAYVGYQFRCAWDNEHGLGFMTHKDRIIDFGGADTSFLTWVAEKDLSSE